MSGVAPDAGGANLARTGRRLLLAALAIVVFYGGYRVNDYLDSRRQYAIVNQAIGLYSSAIRVILYEYWASNGTFPASNVAAGLPDDDQGAWPGFKRVALTDDGRIVFEYEPAAGGGPGPFIFVIQEHAAETLIARPRRGCGGSGLHPRVRPWLTHFCDWDSDLNTYAPAQDGSAQIVREPAPPKTDTAATDALLARYDQGTTPLMLAAGRGDATETARILKDEHATVDAKDKNGATALLYAARGREPAVVQALLAAGADAGLRDSGGASALHWLFKVRPPVHGTDRSAQGPVENRLPIAELLLAKGVDVNAVDNQGLSALHRAADVDDAALAQWLLDHGADIEARDHRSRTPVMYAALSAGGDAALRRLIEHGAQLNVRDGSNQSLLQLTLAQTRPDTEKRYLLLRNAGAR